MNALDLPQGDSLVYFLSRNSLLKVKLIEAKQENYTPLALKARASLPSTESAKRRRYLGASRLVTLAVCSIA